MYHGVNILEEDRGSKANTGREINVAGSILKIQEFIENPKFRRRKSRL